MNVEKKIEELVKKFSQHVNPYVGSRMLTNTPDEEGILWEARHCALILANEMLENIPMYTGELNPKWKYWTDIKIELEKQLKSKHQHS